MATRDLNTSPLKSRAGWIVSAYHLRLALMVGLALALGFGLTYFIASQSSAGEPLAAMPAAPDPIILGCNPYPECGNQRCENDAKICDSAKEYCFNCPQDCGPCATEEPECVVNCGDGVCSECEGTWNCSLDCGNWCGDGICAASEVDSCCSVGPGLDCTVAITCGDGICSACESFDLCPGDCEGAPTEEPTEEVTEEPTDTPTIPSPVTTEEPTEEVTEPPTETPTATSTSTETPTATATSTNTPTPTPEPEEACGLVPYESRPGGWKRSYGGATQPGDYVPINDENAEVFACPIPPDGIVCIPLYGDLLELADGDMTAVTVLDCPEEGECAVYQGVAGVVGDEMCFNSTETAGISCGTGCAFAPLVLDTGPNLPLPLWALGLILLILLLLLILLFVALSRRNRDRQEEEREMD